MVWENDISPYQLCCIRKGLQGTKVYYHKMEKIALTLITVTWKLRYYFLGHPIVVRTGYLIKHILFKQNLEGMMTKWTYELSAFDISSKPRKTLKNTFVGLLRCINHNRETRTLSRWTIFVDGSSNAKGIRVKLLLERDHDLTLEVAVRFEFHTSNNQVR